MSDADDLVLGTVREGVAVLTLNRPDRLNAWSPALERAYGRTLNQAGRDPEVRAVVVTGAGRGFCAGADAGVLGEYSQGDRPAANSLPRPQIEFERTLPKPVIAAINGPCAGIGMVRALLCDLRFASATAFFTTSYAHRGLIAEHGSAWLLARLIGTSRAADLLLSARRVPAAEALTLGLVDRLITGDVLEAAVDYARDLARNCSPAAMATIKGQLWADLDRPLVEAYRDAEQRSVERYDSADFAEGLRAWTEKRPARFAGLSVEPAARIRAGRDI